MGEYHIIFCVPWFLFRPMRVRGMRQGSVMVKAWPSYPMETNMMAIMLMARDMDR